MLVQDTSSAHSVNNFLYGCITQTYRSNLDLPSDSYRSLLDRMQPEHSSLGQVDDWRAHHRSKDAAVADGEGATSHVFERELVVACLRTVSALVFLFGDYRLPSCRGRQLLARCRPSPSSRHSSQQA